MLEVQAVNNKALLKEVEQLLQALDVSPQVRTYAQTLSECMSERRASQ